jgi:hypothetical protein
MKSMILTASFAHHFFRHAFQRRGNIIDLISFMNAHTAFASGHVVVPADFLSWPHARHAEIPAASAKDI